MTPNDLSGLELKHLTALRAVVEEGSFGAAADRLGYTQSAVSQQIAGLERLLGTTLFDRPGGPRKVRLTRAGELLDVHAQDILARVAAARADVVAFSEGNAGRLNIGTFQSIAVEVLPRIVGQLRDESPGLRIELTEHDESAVLADGLVSGLLDVSFLVAYPTDALPVDTIRSWADPFVVISPAAESLAAPGEPVPIDELDGLQMVSQRSNSCQDFLDGNLAGAGIAPDVTFRTGDNSAVQAMVRAGGCHAVMPLLAIDVNDPGVTVHPIDPPLPMRTIELAVASGRTRPPAVERVIELAVRICDELLSPLNA